MNQGYSGGRRPGEARGGPHTPLLASLPVVHRAPRLFSSRLRPRDAPFRVSFFTSALIGNRVSHSTYLAPWRPRNLSLDADPSTKLNRTFVDRRVAAIRREKRESSARIGHSQAAALTASALALRRTHEKAELRRGWRANRRGWRARRRGRGKNVRAAAAHSCTS